MVGAVFDTPGVTAEIICDGFHIHPAALRIAFHQLRGRICVISDSMRAAGLSDGVYDLGGQAVTVKGKMATLADGTIAGSVTNLHQELKNLVSYGVPMEEALRAMTLTPAAKSAWIRKSARSSPASSRISWCSIKISISFASFTPTE